MSTRKIILGARDSLSVGCIARKRNRTSTLQTSPSRSSPARSLANSPSVPSYSTYTESLSQLPSQFHASFTTSTPELRAPPHAPHRPRFQTRSAPSGRWTSRRVGRGISQHRTGLGRGFRSSFFSLTMLMRGRRGEGASRIQCVEVGRAFVVRKM